MIEFCWVVIEWKKLWRQLWYKTANIKLDIDNLEDWVYKINWIVDSKIFSWAWVYLKDLGVFESHFFDLNYDIYWEKIEIVVLEKIRDNKKFDSIDDLKKQIGSDIKIIKSKTNYVITFWTFDVVHPGHKYYLEKAKKYWDKLITVIARDKNVEKLKNIKCLNNETTRSSGIMGTKIPDLVVLWDLIDPLKVIKDYKPKVVCLWYDQEGFIKKLEKYIEENNLKIEIIRLGSYKPDKYKSSILKEQLK